MSFTWPPPDGGDLDVMDLGEQAPARPAPTGDVQPAADLALVPAEQAEVDGWDLSGIETAQATAPRQEQASWPGPQKHRSDKEGRAARNAVRGWMTRERLIIAVLALIVVALATVNFLRPSRSDIAATAANIKPGLLSSGGAGAAKSKPGLISDAGKEIKPGPISPAPGRLVVNTVPPGGAVSVDGRSVGTAPVTVPDLAAGDHTVVVQSQQRTVQQQVHIRAGQDLTLLVPLPVEPSGAPAPAATTGWVTVNSPFEVRIADRGRVVGTSAMRRVELAPGRHTLQFLNPSVGYEQAQDVVVQAGKTARVQIEVSKQTVVYEARPWAEVWVDGTRIGETTVGTVPLTPGPHVFEFRHPELGNQTVRTIVRVDEPSRVTVDLRK